MTKPAKRTQKDKIGIYIKRQAWVLFVLITAAALLDMTWLQSQLIITRSTAIGALLSFTAQVVFASFIFWHTGYRASGRIVSQLYRGQMVKWLLTIFGFAFIFISIKPLSAFSVFVGFVIMQMSHNIMLLRIR